MDESENGKYSAIDVANYVIQYCNSKEKPITNLMLQKILYFIEGEFFKVKRDVIIEDFEAWKHGPVIPVIYDTFCIYGGSPLLPNSDSKNKISQKDIVIINSVIDSCINKPVWELVRKTHDTDPWKNTYSMFGKWSRISKTSMKKYFENINQRCDFDDS